MRACVIAPKWALIFCLFGLGVLTILGAKQARALETSISGMIIHAEDLELDSESGRTILTGNVQIIFQNQHLSTQQAIIDKNAKTLEAVGDVVIFTPQATIGGERIVLNYDTNQGTIYQGYVEAGQVLFEGERIRKIGESTYDVTGGVYTACGTCPPAWAFSGTRIEAELGGYAKIRYPLFEIGGFPVLWLPYLIVPLKSSRQTGLLNPTFEGGGTGGFAIAQSFFWAISRSQDATFALKNYQHRGLQGLANYRYLLSENSGGEFNAAWINDRAFGKEDRLNRFRSQDEIGDPVNRWFAEYEHYYELPGGFVQRMDLNLASDLQYTQDFPRETGILGDPALVNRASLTKNTEDTHARIETAYYVNLLQADPLADNDEAVHRLPEIALSGTKNFLGATGFLFDYNLHYTHFSRAHFGYDDLSKAAGEGQYYVDNTCDEPTYRNSGVCELERDGEYNPGSRTNNFADADLIRAGQRLDMQPTLSYPLNIADAVDIYPSVSYRETHYHFAVDQNPINVRKYLRTSVSARSTFTRIFGDLDDPKGTRYKHEIQPEIALTKVPWIDQPNHPFFFIGEERDVPFFRRESISDEDLRGENRIQFDADDRLYDRDLITLAFTSKLIEKNVASGDSVYRQLVRLRIAQNYDAYHARLLDDPAKGWQDLQTDLDIRLNQFQTNTIIRYFPQSEVSDIKSRLRVNNRRNDFFQVEWTRRYDFAEGIEEEALLSTNDYRLTAGITGRYIDMLGQIVYDAKWERTERKEPIKSWAHITRFKVPGNCWHVTLLQSMQTKNTGKEYNWNIGFEFKFDGQNFTGLDPSTLQFETF